jgi:anti-sigma B factor antagonist
VQFVTDSSRDGGWSVVTIAGELDVIGGPELRQQVMTEIREGRHRLVLDLTGVDFIDSFGLGVIVGALKRVRLLDGDLRLVVPEPRIRRVFEVCDLDRVFALHTTLDEAIASGAG